MTVYLIRWIEHRVGASLPHIKIYLKVLFLRFFCIPANIATNECIITVLLSQVIMTKDDIIRYWVSSSDKDLMEGILTIKVDSIKRQIRNLPKTMLQR